MNKVYIVCVFYKEVLQGIHGAFSAKELALKRIEELKEKFKVENIFYTIDTRTIDQ